MYFLTIFLPRAGTFADAREGDGGGGHLGPFETTLGPVWGRFGHSFFRVARCCKAALFPKEVSSLAPFGLAGRMI